MKRYCIILWAIIVLAVLLASCTQQKNPATGGGETSTTTTVTTTEVNPTTTTVTAAEANPTTTASPATMTTVTSSMTTIQETTTTTTFVGGTCGGGWDYSRYYSIFFSIESRMEKLVDKEEYDAWCDTFDGFEAGGTRNTHEYNVYTLIHEFSIPREEVERICEEYERDFPDDIYFTDEMVEVLYTGTELEVYRYFANPCAVMVGKDAFPPQWLATHTAEEYREVGITYEILNAKLADVFSVCSAEVQQHIRTQLAALA